MMEYVTLILTLLTPLLIIMLYGFLVPYAKKVAATTGSTVLEKLALFAASFAEAEARKLESPSGKEKMDLAFGWLKTQAIEQGIEGTDELLRGLIETAVAQGTAVGWFPHVTKLSEDQMLKAFMGLMKDLETKAQAAGIKTTPEVLLSSLQSLRSMVTIESKPNENKTDGKQ